MNEQDYLNLDFRGIETSFELDRRDFLKLFGGGIFILFGLGDLSALPYQRGGRGLPADFNAFLRIAEDGTITGYSGKVELGQGPTTSLAQLLADELDAPLEKCRMVLGDTDLCPYDMGTFGSMTIRIFGPPFRAAAAEARGVLLELASEQLKVPVSQLTAEAGEIFVKSDKSKRVTYGQLAQGKKIVKQLENKPPVKKHTEFKVIGKPLLRLDGKDKVTGAAKYAGDIRLPGMLYARLLRPPAHGANRKSLDVSKAKSMEGVQVVEEGDLVAVLHESPAVAEEALEQVKAEWDVPEATVVDKTIFEHLLNNSTSGNAAARGGSLAEGQQLSTKVVEKTYLDGYVAHAPIETHTAVVKIEEGKATVWASTQGPFGVQSAVARALGFAQDKVRVITPYVGGGFGGKTSGPQAVEAARLAQATGKPVQVCWTRAEEFFYDTFRPAAVVKIKAGVTDAGKLTLWDYNVYHAGSRGAEHFYDIPHHQTIVTGAGWQGGGPHPLATGAWRAPANNTNTFARESHIDVMAAAAGVDPVEFRLNNLKDKRMIGVLKAAAEKFGYQPAKAPSGRGYGCALGIDAGTYVAHIAEVEVNKRTGSVQVKRVVCAQDMGLAVNPAGAIIQAEGCITMGLGYALSEDIRFKGGDILDKSFGTYQIPRISWTPKIEIVLIDAQDQPAQGGGEPAIICMGALIANAIYDAIGVRMLQLPMSPERVRAAAPDKNAVHAVAP